MLRCTLLAMIAKRTDHQASDHAPHSASAEPNAIPA
jgi:hypothetical protein